MDSTQEMESANANGEVSDGVDKQNSFDAERFKQDILNTVKDLISDPRTTQSQKDKVIAEIKKDKGFKDFFREFKSMQEQGYSEREIEQEFRIREMEETRVSHNSNGNAVSDNKVSTAKVLAEALGLNMNDPDVMRVMLSGNLEEQATKLSELSQRNKKEASPALAAQPSGMSKTPDLLDEYRQAIRTLRGDALIRAKMEFRKRGLDIN